MPESKLKCAKVCVFHTSKNFKKLKVSSNIKYVSDVPKNCALKPHSNQKHVKSKKSNDSFDKSTFLRHCCRFLATVNVGRIFVLSTKYVQLKKMKILKEQGAYIKIEKETEC